jgi:hypothetical protein
MSQQICSVFQDGNLDYPFSKVENPMVWKSSRDMTHLQSFKTNHDVEKASMEIGRMESVQALL